MRDNQERRKDLRRDASRDRRPAEREDAENMLEGRNALPRRWPPAARSTRSLSPKEAPTVRSRALPRRQSRQAQW